ncbi:hypothetical protein V5799_017369 [Amblyomma americanum]|uniref:Uncharacterized protein n=1 Tax=Amblyomma americanum TaxID=6943 RepID=A0AAQ4F2X8_AMBAM
MPDADVPNPIHTLMLMQFAQFIDHDLTLTGGTRCDARVNEQVGLTAMHTLWMREHNRVAAELLRLNPGWKDEILYQEARRIVAAEFQHITYNEYLPILLGRDLMKEFDLLLTPSGYSGSYDPQLNAGIVNVFATASYRYGHSLVQLTNHLFEPPGFGFGADLAAFNVQRGRDHGIPSYNDWREFCGMSRITDFSQLADVMSPQAAQSFAQVYKHPDDIDLFAAGVNERPIAGGTLGPTFACSIGEQFRRLKNGDRFWYENGGLESSLNEGIQRWTVTAKTSSMWTWTTGRMNQSGRDFVPHSGRNFSTPSRVPVYTNVTS